MAGEKKGSEFSVGGMKTKLQAAEICLGCGCNMVIANGKNPDNLYAILDGKEIGTLFAAATDIAAG